MDDLEPPKGTELVVVDHGTFANLMDTARFNHLYRVGKMFANSGMVPKHYAQKPSACMVASLMAMRCEIEPLMFMQHSYVSPDGKPALSAQLAIALINTRGPFKGPVNFDLSGEGDTRKCVAWQLAKGSNQRCEVDVSLQIAKDEGWHGRNSKWRTMTDQMLRYRAGTWLGRAYCPEVLMGMQTAEEVEDVTGVSLERGDDNVYRPAAPAPSEAPPRPSLAPRAAPPKPAVEPDAPPPDPVGEPDRIDPDDEPDEPEEDIVLQVADAVAPAVTVVPTNAPPFSIPPLRVWPTAGSRGLDWERFKRDVVEVANTLPPVAVDAILAEYGKILANMQKQSSVLHRGLIDWLENRRATEAQP